MPESNAARDAQIAGDATAARHGWYFRRTHRGRRSFPERAVEFQLGEIRACLLQDLVGGTQLPDLALQFLDPVPLCAGQTKAFTSIAFGALAPDAKAVRRAAELRRNRPIRRIVAGIFGTVFLAKPDAPLTQFGWVGRGLRSLAHHGHPWSSGSPVNPGQFR